MDQLNTQVTIIGAGLTGLTLAYYLSKVGKKVVVLEKEPHIGGVIQTAEEKGFVFETGPNTGILGSVEIIELFDDLKDAIEVEVANPEAEHRWIWKGGKWNPLPSGMISAIATPLFTFSDKLRILGEPFRKPGNYPDENVADLVKRRLGKSFLDYAVDPFISGIYAGDPEKLVTRFALPKLYNLEQKYGSFIRGSFRKAKEPKGAIEKRVTRKVFSVKGGLGKLTNALYQKTGARNFITGCKDLQVQPGDKGFIVSFTDNNGKTFQLESQKVISTICGKYLPEVFPFIEKTVMDSLSNARYAKVVQVAACYHQWKGIPVNAFGGLVPSVENRQILGVLFPSSLFSQRANDGGAVLSVFMGGIKRPDFIEKTDEEIKEIALGEIRDTLKSTSIPDVLKIFRYPAAIPQYEASTTFRLKAIEKMQHQYPGLFLAGNIRDGIGMADRVKQAKQFVNALIS